MTYKAVQRLKQESAVRIHYLTKEKFKPIIRLNACIDVVDTISDRASFRELVQKTRELAGLGFSDVYDFHNNIRSTVVRLLLRVLSPSVKCHKIRKKWFMEILLFIVKRKVFQNLFPGMLDRSKATLVLKASARQTETVKFSEKWRMVPESLSQRFSSSARYIAIAPESLWEQKQWAMERFEAVAERLQKAGCYKIVWLGLKNAGKSGQHKAARLAAYSIDLTGKTSLADIPYILSRCRLLISNDSGLMHISEWVGTPVVAIFGPTSPELGFAPDLKNSIVVQDDLWCRPCSKSGKYCFRIINKQKCLSNINTEDVINAATKILERPTE